MCGIHGEITCLCLGIAQGASSIDSCPFSSNPIGVELPLLEKIGNPKQSLSDCNLSWNHFGTNLNVVFSGIHMLYVPYDDPAVHRWAGHFSGFRDTIQKNIEMYFQDSSSMVS